MEDSWKTEGHKENGNVRDIPWYYSVRLFRVYKYIYMCMFFSMSYSTYHFIAAFSHFAIYQEYFPMTTRFFLKFIMTALKLIRFA